jgi:GNAT superfamily N-acetyltransferase
MNDTALKAVIHDPGIEIHAVADRQGIEIGLLELDYREPRACKIAYFGLVPELTGKGHGRWLMAHALMLGWRSGVERMWVHTCTLDHRAALGFYRAQGFIPYAQAIETFPDPRILGLLAADAAPHIPLLAESRR